MSRTVTALFDTRADAEAGRERLLAANIDADNVRIHDKASTGVTADAYSTTEDTGMWSSIKNAFLPDEDRHTYEEGVRRGGFLLTADVDEDEIKEAVRVLEEANGVDMDERSTSWKNEGWAAPAPLPMSDRKPAMFNNDRTGDDESIEIVEERLVVGKREVERGGMRVRSYVTEVPVHEQVRLRNERVELERRPVDREVGNINGNAFQERSISMTETDEEAVVGKTARVVEEVSLRKTSDERVEDINETVRKTDVEIEDLSGVDRGMSRDAQSMSDSGAGNTAAGLGKEALGNVKQGLGALTGNEDLKRSGEAQEREGEAQQGKRTDRTSY